MIDLDYAFHHMESVIGVIAGRPGALERMDISSDGFWRSFSAIIVALPALFFVWVINAVDAMALSPDRGLAGPIAMQAVLDLAGWLVPVALFAVILKPLGFGGRFVHLIIARNWFTALFSYLEVIVHLSGLVWPGGGMMMVALGAVLAVLVLFAFVRLTRAALDSSLRTAIVFVAVELGAGLALVAGYVVLVAPAAG